MIVTILVVVNICFLNIVKLQIYRKIEDNYYLAG